MKVSFVKRGIRFISKSAPVIRICIFLKKSLFVIGSLSNGSNIKAYPGERFEIVIARYNEDITWSDPLRHNRTIYNKGKDLPGVKTIQLPNVGRESHTYLWHIINNYDRLADITLFTQGDIDEGSFLLKFLKKEPGWKRRTVLDTILNGSILERAPLFASPFIKKGIAGLDKDYRIKFFGKWKKELDSGKIQTASSSFKEWMERYIFSKHFVDPGDIIWAPHAIFYAHKDLIRSNPKEYYRKLLSFVDHHVNPMEGHYMERSWFQIFARNTTRKIAIIVKPATSPARDNTVISETVRRCRPFGHVDFYNFGELPHGDIVKNIDSDIIGWVGSGLPIDASDLFTVNHIFLYKPDNTIVYKAPHRDGSAVFIKKTVFAENGFGNAIANAHIENIGQKMLAHAKKRNLSLFNMDQHF